MISVLYGFGSDGSLATKLGRANEVIWGWVQFSQELVFWAAKFWPHFFSDGMWPKNSSNEMNDFYAVILFQPLRIRQ